MPQQHSELHLKTTSGTTIIKTISSKLIISRSQDCLRNNAAYNGKGKATRSKEIINPKLDMFYISFNLSPEYSDSAPILKRALLLC